MSGRGGRPALLPPLHALDTGMLLEEMERKRSAGQLDDDCEELGIFTNHVYPKLSSDSRDGLRATSKGWHETTERAVDALVQAFRGGVFTSHEAQQMVDAENDVKAAVARAEATWSADSRRVMNYSSSDEPMVRFERLSLRELVLARSQLGQAGGVAITVGAPLTSANAGSALWLAPCSVYVGQVPATSHHGGTIDLPEVQTEVLWTTGELKVTDVFGKDAWRAFVTTLDECWKDPRTTDGMAWGDRNDRDDGEGLVVPSTLPAVHFNAVLPGGVVEVHRMWYGSCGYGSHPHLKRASDFKGMCLTTDLTFDSPHDGATDGSDRMLRSHARYYPSNSTSATGQYRANPTARRELLPFAVWDIGIPHFPGDRKEQEKMPTSMYVVGMRSVARSEPVEDTYRPSSPGTPTSPTTHVF